MDPAVCIADNVDPLFDPWLVLFDKFVSNLLEPDPDPELDIEDFLLLGDCEIGLIDVRVGNFCCGCDGICEF